MSMLMNLSDKLTTLGLTSEDRDMVLKKIDEVTLCVSSCSGKECCGQTECTETPLAG